MVEERRRDPGELRKAAQVVHLLAREAQIQQILHRLLQPGGDNEIARARQPAEEQLEATDLAGFAGFEIAGGHGELIEVSEQAGHVRLVPAAGHAAAAAFGRVPQ